MNAYRKWLKARIAELSTLQEYEPDDQLWDHASLIVAEAARRAAELGLTNLVEASLSLPKLVNCYTAVGFLSTCVAKAGEPREGDLLTLTEAAQRLRLSPETLKGWVNHLDPKTGLAAPKIRCVRVGSKGRPSKKTGKAGAIMFDPLVVQQYLDGQTVSRIDPPQQQPRPKSLGLVPQHLSPPKGYSRG